MKESTPIQFRHLQEMDESIDSLKVVYQLNPASPLLGEIKQRVFKHYYGATRLISRDENYNLKIEVDEEMVNILSGRVK